MHPYILPSFQGPIDLLVLLVQREELNIMDFSIQELIRQYIAKEEDDPLDDEITTIRDLSSLVHLKTTKLLPLEAQEENEPEEEPPSQFLEHLIHYATCKNLAHELAKKEEIASGFFLRGSEESLPKDSVQTAPVSLQDFAQAFEKILQAAERRKLYIHNETWTVEDKIKLIKQMTKHDSLSFTTLFSLDHSKEELIVTFLALLELLKQERIQLHADAQCTFIITKKVET